VAVVAVVEIVLAARIGKSNRLANWNNQTVHDNAMRRDHPRALPTWLLRIYPKSNLVRDFLRWRWLSLLIGMLCVLGERLHAGDPAPASLPLPRVLFETSFEPWEGYDLERDLSEQNGWISEGTGGNGILEGPLVGFDGNVAYIGFSPPAKTNDFLNVWRPVGLQPLGKDLPVVQFNVVMQVFDSSTNAPYFDDFRWSVYNTAGDRLFTLDFANEDREINYALDDGKGFVKTGFGFRNDESYELVILMNFHRNVWTARVNDVVVVNGMPMSTQQKAVDFGDMDVVWAVNQVGKPGDNYMVFDDYQLTAQPVSSIPAMLEPLGLLNRDRFLLRVFGEPGLTYRLETSEDLVNWLPAGSGIAQQPGGYVDFQHAMEPQGSQKFFRAQAVAP